MYNYIFLIIDKFLKLNIMDYYKNQLEKINPKGEYPSSFQIVSPDNTKTKWMNLNNESANAMVEWLKNNFKVNSANEITTSEISINGIEDHLNEWFGVNWGNQNSAQVYAMVIDLLEKVKINITK